MNEPTKFRKTLCINLSEAGEGKVNFIWNKKTKVE